MQLITKVFETPNGQVEGICTKWEGFSILTISGPKGFLACPAIDADMCNNYGTAVALVESGPDNPIGTIERFCDRKISKANAKAQELGIKVGMVAKDVFELLA
jgi:uncharacterized protein YunC (DUF1805 family)